MDRETARRTIKEQIQCSKYLEPSKNGLYCCPYCGSGKGQNATGALKVYNTNTFTCHACGKSGDILDLYRKVTGADYNTALTELANDINITIDTYRPTAAAEIAPESRYNDFLQKNDNLSGQEQKSPQRATESQIQHDYTEYYKECRQRITDPEAVEYLQNRGISLETAQAYWIGYDPQADPAQSNHPCKRLIIPTNQFHFIGRSIDPDTPPQFSKMNNRATPAIFNAKVLESPDTQEIFITEGIFDALSVIEIGATAISLNSTNQSKKLIEQLRKKRTKATLILCLDNDAAGQKATETIKAGLKELNINYIVADICNGNKDPNAALVKDKDTFATAVQRARTRANKPDNTKLYIDALMQNDIDRYKNDIKTGYPDLDKKADGLYNGLYVLAAASSLGKTTFALQMADQLAEQGHEVLFFSLEQSRLELVTKSLARLTAQNNLDTAVTSLSIRKGKNSEAVQDAIKKYKDTVADRISIIEGNFNCDITFIGNYIKDYIERTGITPVVFIDYLQILQPAEDNQRQSQKEATDKTVTELKRLTRELDTPIIAISSVNRANYLNPIDFESLKETGGIEYTADVIWGLQLQYLDHPDYVKTKEITKKRELIRIAKADTPRKIELVCLKNRYGISSYKCYFNYYPANDLVESISEFNEDYTSGIDWDNAI